MASTEELLDLLGALIAAVRSHNTKTRMKIIVN